MPARMDQLFTRNTCRDGESLPVHTPEFVVIPSEEKVYDLLSLVQVLLVGHGGELVSSEKSDGDLRIVIWSYRLSTN